MNSISQPYIPNAGNYPYQDSVNMYQQRLNNMAQQVTGQGQQNGFNGMIPPLMQMQNAIGGIGNVQGQTFNVRVVTGYEEAMASQTPLDGSVSILIDRSHDMIFTKQLNMNDGTPLVKRYKAFEIPKQSEKDVENSVEYVKKSEFDELKGRFDEVWMALSNKNESVNSKSNSSSTKKEANK